jgi:diguanylate cyclase (GGDEF)-like protein
MNIEELVKYMLYSFFVIFSSAFISLYVYMMIFDFDIMRFRDLNALVILCVLGNLTQLCLYSKKELSRKQKYVRYGIILLLALVINFTVAFHMKWVTLEVPITLVVVAILVLTVGVMLHQTVLNVKKFWNLETEAFIDVLTGAYNRRYFMDTATRTFTSCVNENREFAIILLDLDKFKSINDTYGHVVGDEALRIVVDRARSMLKANTLIARFGGEEFIVMVTDTERESAVRIAWRMQKNIASSSLRVGDSEIAITASFGVAVKTQCNTMLTQVIDNADKALYQAKSIGRNTVVQYDCAEGTSINY